jgi:hypothetical protein
MLEWFENVAGPAYAPALMWTALALLALVVVLLALRVFRSFTFGTFVAGGRNRKPRLAVIDATAVDNQRRLVLVRRDDVEHLILIGGTSDIVVEAGIEATPHAEQPTVAEKGPAEAVHAVTSQPAPLPTPATPPRPAPPQSPQTASRVDAPPPPPAAPARPAPQPLPAAAPASPPLRARPPEPPRQEPRTAPPPPAPTTRSAPQAPQVAAPSAAAVAGAGATGTVARTPDATAEPVPSSAPDDGDLDDALLHELELSLDEDERRLEPQASSSEGRPASIDDEMDRLLGELSGDKR